MRMYGRLVCTAAVGALLCAPLPALAQQPVAYNDEGIGFGVLGGITRSTIHFGEDSGIDNDSVESKNGWIAGIWFGGNRNGTLGFMGEISYAVKGAQEQGGDGEFELHYIQIPALVRVNLGQTNTRAGVIVYPLIGPYVDILVKARDQDDDDLKDFFNGFDAGLMGGVGIEAARFGVEVRYGWGLKSLNAEDGGGFGELTDSKNRTLQIIGKFRLN